MRINPALSGWMLLLAAVPNLTALAPPRFEPVM
jgi:hypothetical protein